MAGVVVVVGMAGAMGRRPGDDTGAGEERVSRFEQRPSEGRETILDTLNRGKELALSKNDFKNDRLVTAEKNDTPEEKRTRRSQGYRIQCLAGTQIESIRRKKQELERQISYPVYIIVSETFYKLVVGDFRTRAEAERALFEIQEQGYSDAWIMRSKINTN
jgi:hypothetical protein